MNKDVIEDVRKLLEEKYKKEIYFYSYKLIDHEIKVNYIYFKDGTVIKDDKDC